MLHFFHLDSNNIVTQISPTDAALIAKDAATKANQTATAANELVMTAKKIGAKVALKAGVQAANASAASADALAKAVKTLLTPREKESKQIAVGRITRAVFEAMIAKDKIVQAREAADTAAKALAKEKITAKNETQVPYALTAASAISNYSKDIENAALKFTEMARSIKAQIAATKKYNPPEKSIPVYPDINIILETSALATSTAEIAKNTENNSRSLLDKFWHFIHID